MPPLALLPGTLDLLVLKAASFRAEHGYGIARRIEERSDGALAIEEGALYQALHRLEHRGALSAEWGTSENGRRAKFYQLTAAGRQLLRQEASAWRRYAVAVTTVLDGA